MGRTRESHLAWLRVHPSKCGFPVDCKPVGFRRERLTLQVLVYGGVGATSNVFGVAPFSFVKAYGDVWKIVVLALPWR